MPRPKCRVDGCDEPAGNFIDIIFVPGQQGTGPKHRETIGFCDRHHDEYQAGDLDISRIGDAVMLDD